MIFFMEIDSLLFMFICYIDICICGFRILLSIYVVWDNIIFGISVYFVGLFGVFNIWGNCCICGYFYVLD